jgi:hypothetical protein
MSTNRGQVRPKKSIANSASFVHARSYDVDGSVMPRCNARRSSKYRLELRVTSLTARVTCPVCRGAALS